MEARECGPTQKGEGRRREQVLKGSAMEGAEKRGSYGRKQKWPDCQTGRSQGDRESCLFLSFVFLPKFCPPFVLSPLILPLFYPSQLLHFQNHIFIRKSCSRSLCDKWHFFLRSWKVKTEEWIIYSGLQGAAGLSLPLPGPSLRDEIWSRSRLQMHARGTEQREQLVASALFRPPRVLICTIFNYKGCTVFNYKLPTRMSHD